MSSVGAPPPAGSSNWKAARSAADPDVARIREAQSEVNSKVNEIQDQLKSIDHEGTVEINNLKDSYEHEALAETSREETLVANEKLKGYERIRDLQKQQAAELSRVKRQGEDDLSRLSGYYRDATARAQRTGDETLRETNLRNQQRVDYETKAGGMTADQVRAEQHADIERLQAEREFQVAALEKQAHDAYDKKRLETNDAIQKSTEQLSTEFKSVSDQHQQVMNRLNNQTFDELQKTKLDHARKLAAFSERAEDPFYQMMDLRAEFEDQGDKYVLTAHIPEYEQNHVTVAVRGNQLVISGSRRNEDKVEVEPGHTKGTNAYQSFMESFPFTQAVETNKVTHEFDGDQITVTLPKKVLASEYKPKKKTVQKLAVQKPNFPENLPHVKDEAVSPAPDQATRGSRTLARE